MVLPSETSLDIRRVLDTLPHRLSFVMIDRWWSSSPRRVGCDQERDDQRAIFPRPFSRRTRDARVLQIEAMAQARRHFDAASDLERREKCVFYELR